MDRHTPNDGHIKMILNSVHRTGQKKNMLHTARNKMLRTANLRLVMANNNNSNSNSKV